MQLRSWISDQFGSSERETLLDESVYSSQQLKEDKIRLRQQRRRIIKEMNEYGAEYQRLLEQGAQASEIEAPQYAQQAKITKKKYKVKSQQHKKNSAQMATVVTIQGARELLEMTDSDPTHIGTILDSGEVDLSQVQEQMMEEMVNYELDMDMMMEIQEALDIDIIASDTDLEGGEEMEIIEKMRAGEIDSEQIDIDAEVEDEADQSLDDLGSSLGIGEDLGPDI